MSLGNRNKSFTARPTYSTVRQIQFGGCRMRYRNFSLIITLFATVFLNISSFGSSNATESINQFSCSVTGYSSLTFDLSRKNMSQDFEFRMTDTTRKFHWDLLNGNCQLHENSDFEGTFYCHSSESGQLAIELILTNEKRIRRYDQFMLDVQYRRDPHFSYPQRVINLVFSGGDFETPLKIQKIVNVSFYEGNDKVFTVWRESCSLNGSVIKE